VVAQSISTLFDQHASMVLGLCRLLLRDHHEAEDAAQQTFVSAYRSMLRGSDPRDPAPWLAAIARNECRARIRKRMRAPIAIDGEIEAQLADPEDLVEVADRRAELAEITTAMADLPTRQREAVALRDFLGLSYEEVASTLSVSVPVVESLLFRARRRLRDTVRTVPRYAAGAAVVPLALRGSVAREIPDFDSMRLGAGLVAGAAAAMGVGIAKLISIPFAGKAVTAAAVATASTVVGPLFTGPPPPSDPGVAAPAIAEVSGGPVAPDAPEPSAPTTAHVAEAPVAAEPPPPDASAPPANAVESQPEPSVEADDVGIDPDRMSAESATSDGSLDLPPVEPAEVAVPVDCQTAEDEAEEFEDALETNDAEVVGEPATVEEPCVEEPEASASEEPEPAAQPTESPAPVQGDEADQDDDAGDDDQEPADEPNGEEASADDGEVLDDSEDAGETSGDSEESNEAPLEHEAPLVAS
jgi:RNA polymerase sigma-70 factor (ECF subfamily)